MKTVEAIYEQGVLRPLERLRLSDGRHVMISIEEEEVDPTQPPNNMVEPLHMLAGCLKDSSLFAKDPVAIQKTLRDEWS